MNLFPVFRTFLIKALKVGKVPFLKYSYNGNEAPNGAPTLIEVDFTRANTPEDANRSGRLVIEADGSTREISLNEPPLTYPIGGKENGCAYFQFLPQASVTIGVDNLTRQADQPFDNNDVSSLIGGVRGTWRLLIRNATGDFTATNYLGLDSSSGTDAIGFDVVSGDANFFYNIANSKINFGTINFDGKHLITWDGVHLSLWSNGFVIGQVVYSGSLGVNQFFSSITNGGMDLLEMNLEKNSVSADEAEKYTSWTTISEMVQDLNYITE